MKTRAQALELLHQYVTSESLRKHCLAVEASMRWYAKKNNLTNDEVDQWGICGLLHDFDYEKYPDPAAGGHPMSGAPILRDEGYPEEMIEAILGHATYSGVPRTSQMAKTLFAVDELSGFCVACTYVRPDKSIFTLEPKSVIKKLKTKEFAKGCNRDDITLGAQELGVPMEEHINNVLLGLREWADALGIKGTAIVPT
jgi:putative nucleotidyltransferase with HDIG domain